MKDQPALFMVRAGSNGEDEDFALENNLAIIGFNDIPSVADSKDFDSVYHSMAKAWPDKKPRAVQNYARQMWMFKSTLEVGDWVVLPRKLTSQIAIGKVTGPYEYRKIGNAHRHVRAVKWLRQDLPRTAFKQDLLYSFGAFITVCRIKRNNAEQRVSMVLNGKPDPGFSGAIKKPKNDHDLDDESMEVTADLAALASDQIIRHIQSNFKTHDLARLVNEVLKAEGWVSKLSPPGPDGGVDILAGRGSLGLDQPRLCVQVKSQESPADVTIYRTLQGTMQTFKADQGLLVCWGGFNRVVETEARQGHFLVRLWNRDDLVAAICRNYDRLSAEIQAEIPLKKVWMLVPDESEE